MDGRRDDAPSASRERYSWPMPKVAAGAVLVVLVAACSSSYAPRSQRRLSIVMSGGTLAAVRGGQETDLGMFGGGLEEAVRGVPQAEEAARTFHNRMVTGFLAGVGGMLCSTIAVGAAAEEDINGDDSSTELSVGLGCLGVAFVGFMVMASGPPLMYDAVNIYNDAVELPPSPAPIPYAPRAPAGPPGGTLPPSQGCR